LPSQWLNRRKSKLKRIPFLYEQAFQWYTSFDPLGELIDRPNPTPALKLLLQVLDHLVQYCSWPPNRIHLFGFAQGGSVAAELLRPLGSIVSIVGPLLSYPTLSKKCQTPVLVYHRPPLSESTLSSSAITAFKKAFDSVLEVKIRGAEGMPRSKDEWEPIMKFWSVQLGRRQLDGLYEVLSGSAP